MIVFMDNPHALIVFIPLINLKMDLHEINLNGFKDVSRHFNASNQFDQFERFIVFEKPIQVIKKDFKKYLNFVVPSKVNKVNLKIEFYHLQGNSFEINVDLKGKELELKEVNGLYFIRLEFYSSRSDIDYTRFIQLCYEKKIDILDFIEKFCGNSVIQAEFREVIKNPEITIPFMHFSIIYFSSPFNMYEIANLYKTRLKIYKDYRIEVAADSIGKTTIFTNQIKTTHSAVNLKIIILRFFLIRLFSYLNLHDSVLDYSYITQDFFKYCKYLTTFSSNKDIYTNLLKVKNYRLDFEIQLRFSKSQLRNILTTVKNEEKFCIDVIIPILEDLGYKDIKFTHGTHEYGIDIIFSNVNNFGLLEWNAIVAKFGDVKLKEGTDINKKVEEISRQIYQSKTMKHSDLNYDELKITRIVVVTNGSINYNAKKALESLNPLIKGNIFFIDKDLLLNLASN